MPGPQQAGASLGLAVRLLLLARLLSYFGGLAIDRTLSYAPTSAWVAPLSGNATAALESIDALQKLPDVAHVEPQLVMQRATRK